MTQSKHTPTQISARDIFGIDDRNFDKYSHTEIYDGRLSLLGKIYNPELAAFIVKAVNCHDELVKQLQDMTFKFQRLESVASAVLRPDQMQEYKECWSASIAALAKANE